MKRAKGLLKKSIELSILCDQEVFLFVYDKEKKKVIHFSSDPELDMYDLFNSKNDREYFSNVDYVKVGGEQQEWDTVSHYDQEEVKKCLKT